MKKNKKDTTFRFGIVEDDCKNVMIEVTAEDYQRQRAAGVPEDELLSGGFHKGRRGGFLERHPNLSRKTIKIKVLKDKKEVRVSAENDKDKKAA